MALPVKDMVYFLRKQSCLIVSWNFSGRYDCSQSRLKSDKWDKEKITANRTGYENLLSVITTAHESRR